MCRGNAAVFDSIVKAKSVLDDKGYARPMCSISGGADSDCILAITWAIRKDIDYVWFNTGLEYQATKDHLDQLEQRYGIRIRREAPEKPVPVSCREFGVPFKSKHVSEMCYRLQKHGFQWEDEPYEVLIQKYPKCVSALSWWCNRNKTQFNIRRNPYLKEFMVENPPQFRISAKCCTYSKHRVASRYIQENGCDLNIMGVRKAEGGVRLAAYKSCFQAGAVSEYRPIFWYSDADRKDFEEIFQVTHSRCYSEYGLGRTGCSGCPCAGPRLAEELEVMQKYEPRLYKAVWNVFGASYEYTRKYEEYRNGKRNEEVPGGPE